MLRRIQWNFFRLENEHIGNADQYRVTKEVPLPYKFTNEQVEEDSDEDKDELDNQARSPGRRFSLHRRRPSQGTMPTGPSSDRAGLSPAQIQSSSSPWKEPDQAFSLGGPALPTDTVEEARQIPTSPSISSLRKVSGLIGPPMSPVWGTGLGVVQKPSGLGPVDE
ncbi:hypothetical protein FRC03_006650 [Tulasnella sp. 419]|nr:hypothetical protein FRC03_006650 [Tulasnella sp. 419]